MDFYDYHLIPAIHIVTKCNIILSMNIYITITMFAKNVAVVGSGYVGSAMSYVVARLRIIK